MTLAEQIKGKQVVLIVVPKKNYKNCMTEIIKAVESTEGRICYASMNKSHELTLKDLRDNNAQIDRYFFIDVLSNGAGDLPIIDSHREIIKTPNALSELSMAFTKATIEKGCGEVLFDAISTLTGYHDEGDVLKLINGMVNKARTNNLRTIYIAIKEDDRYLVDDMSMFADSVIDLAKKKERGGKNLNHLHLLAI
ncbi:hypothetical protein JW826_05200 [Candidatus Woesearchaeota archaeon]|nr:hypothetical protein [Candidatus Woesearchaeota archaeon]